MEDLILPNTQKAKHYRHGYKTAGKYSPEYAAWMNMRARCNNPKSNRYKTYGARGIKVCERWESDFLNFLADMGRRPSADHSIERKDNDRNYEPGNCIWATRKEQARNRRTSRFIVVDDVSLTLAEWSEVSGINSQTIHSIDVAAENPSQARAVALIKIPGAIVTKVKVVKEEVRC